MTYARYAIFHVPQGGLADMGTAWLGWDSILGHAVPAPDIPELDVPSLTDVPRKYGLHGTLKPPFSLAESADPAQLEEAVAKLCENLAPVDIAGLELAVLGRFMALVPQGDQTAVSDLAAKSVTLLDRFRAPPSQAELARRRAGHLNKAQERYLCDWGYPHVLDEYRFHITLTGRLPKSHIAPVSKALRTYLEHHLGAPYRLETISLMGEGADGMFRQIKCFALGGS